MNLSRVEAGDKIECVKLGRSFIAVVREKEPGGHYVRIDPPKGISYYRLSAREVRRKI